MKSVAIVQARTASSRLFGKALLPVAGFPCAILATLRAANRGHCTILATSDQSSDDTLAANARNYGIEVFRGPMDDVLSRFFFATANLSDDDVLIRLTADNVVPDGAFVEENVEAFSCSDAEYLDTDSSLSRLPYGVGAEIFSVATLRKAHSRAFSPSDREHVGPWMKQNCKSAVFVPKLCDGSDFSNLRCTIDEQEDYRRILGLFDRVSKPVEIGWLDLVRKLDSLSSQHESRLETRNISGSFCSAFTLGTAQLGMDYGWVNSSGKPRRQDAIEIIRNAVSRGVTVLDTARAYGDAETVIGEALAGMSLSAATVVTKLDLSRVPPHASEFEVRERVDESIAESCRALRRPKLDTVLLHDWSHHTKWDGAAWERLLEQQRCGRIEALGASVYQPNEAIDALRDPAISHLQLPMNVLDWRWTQVARAVAERPEVSVYARSVLLQGILAHPPECWPRVPGFDGVKCARKLAMLAEKFGRDGLVDLCLSYVRSLPWITSVVVGCETLHQLEKNLELFFRPKLQAEQVEELEQELPRAPEELLNPSKWNLIGTDSSAYAS